MRLPHGLTGFLIVDESQYRRRDDRSPPNADTVNTKNLQHVHTHTPHINDQMKNTPSLPTIINSFPTSHIADHAKAPPPVNNLSHPNVFKSTMLPFEERFRNSIRDFRFMKGDLVLVCNNKIDMELFIAIISYI